MWVPELQSADQIDPASMPTRFPSWWDPEAGRIRELNEIRGAVELYSGAASTDRNDATTIPAFQNQWNWNWSWPQWLQDIIDMIQGFFIGWEQWQIIAVLAMFGMLFLGLILWFLLRSDFGRRLLQRRQLRQKRRRAVTREELPFEFEAETLTVSGLWAEALRARQSQDYRRALMFLYSYLLVELDAHQWIRLSRGKTNRTYRLEIAELPVIRPVFESTMDAFEKVFFGRYGLDKAEVDDLFHRVEKLELK